MRDNEKGEDWEKEKLNNGWHPTRPSTTQFNVVRRVYVQETLNKDADYQTPNPTFGQRVKKFVRNCNFGECLRNSIPIVKWLPKYNIRNNLMGDFIAGSTTAVLNIPQGMAYSLLAYCSPTTGLYMAFFPVFIYIIFGNSPHISLGTFAVTMLMASTVVLEHATVPDESEGPYTPEQVVSVLSFTAGLILLAMWALRLGAVSSLLSEQLVSGLTTGASFHVCASQLKDLFGIHLPKLPSNFKIIFNVIEVCKNLSATNLAAFTISLISCCVLAVNNDIAKPWLGKRCRVPVPMELIIIVTGTLVSNIMDLGGKYDVALVGAIPTGLPMPALPPFELIDDVFMVAVTITMVTYTITLSMGLIFANKDKYEIDANQELLAMGASNIFGSFFLCAPICASLSRSYVQYLAGCKTLVGSLICAMLILLVLLWIGPFFENLPRAVLASIVVVSLKGLFKQVLDFGRFWKLSKLDAMVWLVTFSVTVLINIDIGLVAGVLASIGSLFFHTQTPYTCLLGRVLDTDIYLDIKRYRAVLKDSDQPIIAQINRLSLYDICINYYYDTASSTIAHEIPGIKIFHYCGGLNFASKNMFRAKLFRKTGYLRLTDPPVRRSSDSQLTDATSYVWDPSFPDKTHCVIIDASAMSYVDAPGIKMLVDVSQALANSGIIVLLTGANGPVIEMIERFNNLEKDRLHLLMFPTVHDAVMYYKATPPSKRESAITVSS